MYLESGCHFQEQVGWGTWLMVCCTLCQNEQFLVLSGIRALAMMVCALFSLTTRFKKKQALVPQGYYPFTNLRVVNLMKILISERIKLFFRVSYVMTSIGKKMVPKNCIKVPLPLRPVSSGQFFAMIPVWKIIEKIVALWSGGWVRGGG